MKLEGKDWKKNLWSRFKSHLGSSSIDNKNNSMYDLECFVEQTIKQEIKELTDKMIGEDAGFVDDKLTWSDTRYNSNSVRYGINEKREEIINIVKEYLK